MDLDLRRFAPSLTLDATAVWVAAQSGAVSYPSDGNAACCERSPFGPSWQIVKPAP